ncbi:MAG: hypothetical protein HC837_10395 [Chloroflexaceae bacterium]|nr:hypothetical protein [Chloroflexaceae bacterium]
MDGEVPVRNVQTGNGNNLSKSLVSLSEGLARAGIAVVDLPISLLPQEPRQNLRRTARSIFHSLVSLQRDLADAAGKAIDDWTKDTHMDAAPTSTEASHGQAGK